MKRSRQLVVLLLLLTVVASARKRDPLTEAEADQLRDVRMEPYRRLKLFIKFTDARLDAIDHIRSDPAQTDARGKKIHDLLEDFTALLDEINDNLDTYEGQVMDKDQRKQFRKGLKEVITACDGWDAKLRALRAATETDPQTRRESQDYMFVIQDAQDALKSSAAVAREYAEQVDPDEKPAKKK